MTPKPDRREIGSTDAPGVRRRRGDRAMPAGTALVLRLCLALRRLGEPARERSLRGDLYVMF